MDDADKVVVSKTCDLMQLVRARLTHTPELKLSRTHRVFKDTTLQKSVDQDHRPKASRANLGDKSISIHTSERGM